MPGPSAWAVPRDKTSSLEDRDMIDYKIRPYNAFGCSVIEIQFDVVTVYSILYPYNIP